MNLFKSVTKCMNCECHERNFFPVMLSDCLSYFMY